MPPVIQFDHVSKSFNLRTERPRSFQERFVGVFNRRPSNDTEKFWALRDVSFEIAQAEAVGLIGENGAGKSTALKLMARVVRPTSGQVTLKGQISALLELGTGFHPDLTGRENIFLNGSLHGVGRAAMRDKLDAIIDFAELDQFIDVPVRNYSSGMYVRLAFAVAAHLAREVLLVDEVLAVGDSAFQHKCRDYISQLKRDGTTIVLVSHNLDDVLNLCDRAIWLQDGYVQAAGETLEVANQYLAFSDEHYQQQLAHQAGLKLAQEAAPEENKAALDEDEAGEEKKRWGNREIEIVSVLLLNGSGQPSQTFKTNQPFVIRLHYQAHQTVDKPVFGIAIYHPSGMNIIGPNTKHCRFNTGSLHGDGVIDFHLEALPLLQGRYELSVAVYDDSLTYPYDHHERLYAFEVETGGLGEQFGSFYFPCYWNIEAESESSCR